MCLNPCKNQSISVDVKIAIPPFQILVKAVAVSFHKLMICCNIFYISDALEESGNPVWYNFRLINSPNTVRQSLEDPHFFTPLKKRSVNCKL